MNSAYQKSAFEKRIFRYSEVMGVEIERKFLVNKEKWQSLEKPKGVYMRQGYLNDGVNCTVRVRETETEGFLTIKGRSEGIARAEFEYAIPKADAWQMLETLAKTQLEKTRYKIMVGQHIWEVDIFHGANDGLILAEIELEYSDEAFELPNWVEKEVSDDPRYYNSNLAKNVRKS
jgi:adenylate cyclase